MTTAVGTNLEDGNHNYSLLLRAGKPLTGAQTLRATASYATSSFSRSRAADLEWLYDTTDDPLLPTQGNVLSATAGTGSFDFEYPFLDQSLRFGVRSWRGAVEARHYWPLAARQSIWGAFTAAHQEYRQSSDGLAVNRPSETGSAAFGYDLDRVRSQVGEPRNDLRFSAHAIYTESTLPVESGFIPRYLVFETGLIYRRPQGSIRLTFTYVKGYLRESFLQ